MSARLIIFIWSPHTHNTFLAAGGSLGWMVRGSMVVRSVFFKDQNIEFSVPRRAHFKMQLLPSSHPLWISLFYPLL
jgi:hypothetical protein